VFVPALFFQQALGVKGMTLRRNLLVLGIGFALALVAGWVVFPKTLYVRRAQPLDFHHKTHNEKSGAQCDACHALDSNGEFSGIPRAEVCAGCHADKLGASTSEAILVDHYIKPAHETPWLVYARQPGNVWFSHAIHTRLARLACTECHGTYGESDQTRIYEQNRISGYSRDIWGHSISRLGRAPHDGMKMTDCENCHRRHNVEVGCLGCHQ
jgi:hypothetical protein